MSAGNKPIIGGTGRPVTVAADGSTEWIPIGAGINWDSVTPAGGDTVLEDGTPVKEGEKALRYGTVLVYNEGTPAKQTIDADSLTAGEEFTITVELGYRTYEIPLKKGLTAAEAKDAFQDVLDDAVTDVTEVANVYTVTFNSKVGKVDAVTSDSGDVNISVTATGDESHGLWKEWDGGDNLVHGYVGILNQTIKLSEPTFHTGYWDEDLQGLIRGGLVWRERLNVADGTEQARLLAALPRLYLTPAQ